jgi:hypothetical protein
MWGEAEDRAVVSSNLTDGIKIYQDINAILDLELCLSFFEKLKNTSVDKI